MTESLEYQAKALVTAATELVTAAHMYRDAANDMTKLIEGSDPDTLLQLALRLNESDGFEAALIVLKAQEKAVSGVEDREVPKLHLESEYTIQVAQIIYNLQRPVIMTFDLTEPLGITPQKAGTYINRLKRIGLVDRVMDASPAAWTVDLSLLGEALKAYPEVLETE